MAVAPAIIAPFFWGEGGAKLTPEEIARQRKVLDALTGKTDISPVGHWTQGLARVTDALGSVIKDRRLDAAQQQNSESSRGLIERMLAGVGTPASAGPVASAASSGVAGELAATSPATSAPVSLGGSQQEFIAGLLPAAIEESKRTGVDPRIIVAQAAQETGWGKSAPGNNYFGIKSHGQDGGQTLSTNEVINGKTVRIRDSFRQFASPADSVRGYGDFILQNPRYKALREAQGLDAQLEALQASGYATDPNYSRSVGAIARSIQLPNAEVAAATPEAAIEAIAPLGYVDPAVAAAPPPAFDAGRFGDPVAAPPLPPPTTIQDRPVASVAQALTAPVEVAQAGPGYFPPAPSAPSAQGINPAIIEALSSPYADEQTKRIAGLLLGQQLEQQQAANDPMRALELERAQLELQQMRQPQRQSLINAGDGRLYDPNSGQWITAPGTGQVDAPTVQSFYDDKGQEYKAQWNRQKGEWEQVGGSKMPSGMSLRTNPDGTVELVQGAGAGTKLTEGQGKDVGFYTRGIDADAQLSSLDTQLTDFGQQAAGNLPLGIGNYLRNPEYRQAKQAADSFLTAILRKDTGAAITDQEFQIYGPMFLPVPGDDEGTIQQKRRARQVALLAIRSGLGTAEAIGEANRIALGLSEQTLPNANVQKGSRSGSTEPAGRNRTSSGVEWSID